MSYSTRTHAYTQHKQTWIYSTGHTALSIVVVVAPSQLHIHPTYYQISQIHIGVVAIPFRQCDVFESFFFHRWKKQNTNKKKFIRSFLLLFHFIIWLSHLCIVPGSVDYCSVDMNLNTYDTSTHTHSLSCWCRSTLVIYLCVHSTHIGQL